MHNEFRTEARAALDFAKENEIFSNSVEISIQNYTNCITKFLNLENKIDDDYRALEIAYRRLALYYYNRQTQEDYQYANDCYVYAIQALLQIQNQTDDDCRALESVYGCLAVYYFNRDNQQNYQYARDSYIYAIQALLRLQNVTDDDYRKFTQHYADLADIFRLLCDEVQWNESFESAIKAFECIQNKNENEKLLGNPRENVLAFRNYIGRKTATPHYINGPIFQNHTKLLIDYHNDKNFIQSFGNVHIDDQKMVQKSIEEMLQSMSIHENKTHTFFSNFSRENPKDSEYRATATQFLKNTNIQLTHWKLAEAIQLLLDALEPLRNIQIKSGDDKECIRNIESNIERLLCIKRLADKAIENENSMQYNNPTLQNNNNFGVEGIVFIPQPIRPNANYEYDWTEHTDTDMYVEIKHRI